MQAGELFVTVRPETSGFQGELEGAIAGTPDVEVPVTAEVGDAEAAIAGLEGEAEPVDIEVTADTSDAEAALGDLAGEAGTVEESTQGAAGGVGNLSAAAAGLVGSGGRAGQALTTLTEASGGAALGVAGLAVGLGFVVKEAADAESTVAIANQVIQNMGDGAGITTEGVQALATQIQQYSGFSDESVISGGAFLATLQNIRNEAGAGNDIFDRALTISADLARRMGTDVPAAAQSLGRALTAPEQGLGRLERQVGRFDEATRANIITLAQQGNTLGAQRLILDTLEQRVGGVARAYGDTLSGGMAKAGEAVGELAESLGGVLLPAVTDAVGGITDLVNILNAIPGVSEIAALTAPQESGGPSVWEQGKERVDGYLDSLNDVTGTRFTVDTSGVDLLTTRIREAGLAAIQSVDPMDEVTSAADRQAAAYQRLNDNIDNYLGVTQGVEEAQDALTGSIGDLRDSLHDNGRAWQGNGEHALANRDAARKVVEEYAALTQSIHENGGSQHELQRAAAGTIQSLRQMVTDGQLSEGQFHRLRDSILGVPGRKHVLIDADVQSALNDIETVHQHLLAVANANYTAHINITADAPPNVSVAGPQISAHALGGPIGAGELSLVGERGPELFMPGTSGQIIPNGGFGGAVVNIYNPTFLSGDREAARSFAREVAPHIDEALANLGAGT